MPGEVKKDKVYGGYVEVGGKPFRKGMFDNGTEVEFTAVPLVGYDFVSWGDGKYGSNVKLKVVVDGDLKLNPVFRKASVNITFDIDFYSAKLVCSGGGIYRSGDEVTVECSVPLGFEFVSWTDKSGKVLSKSSKYTFNAVVSAVLKPNLRPLGKI